MRTHVVLPDELVREVDALVGPRKRSEFIEDALRAKLQHGRQKGPLKGAGILKGKNYPHWETPEKTSAWLEELRRVDIERSEEIWRGRKPLG
jgi:Arc/MetJ-type ribon-helix-helix transcriptional regulator